MIPGTSDASETSDDDTAPEDGANGTSTSSLASSDVHGSVAVDNRRNRSNVLIAACAVLLVVAVVAATLAAVAKGNLDSDRRRQHQIRAVSASMVTALMTYDFQRLDDSRRRVLDLSTGRFQKEYDAGAAPLREVLTQTQSRSTGTVKEVFVGDSDSDTAHTIVVADQVLSGVGGTRALTGQQLSLTLVHLKNGGWKVDGLSVDATAGGADDGSQPGTTTPGTPTPSTTAPASPPTTG